MQTKHFYLALALAGALLSGCAPVYARAAFKSTGEYNPAKDEALAKSFLERQASAPESAEQASTVRLFKDSLPPGVSSSDSTVASSDPRLELLGQLSVTQRSSTSFADYQGTGRKVACYPQVPLTWLTLGIWALVPTFYPCMTENWDEGEWIQKTKQATRHMGGNMVVVLGAGQQKFVFKASPDYLSELQAEGKTLDPSKPKKPSTAL